MINLINVTKRYGKTTALDAVDLAVDRGEIFCLLGPNGAGKTTAIKLICGLLQPDGGQILVNGYDIVTQYQKAKEYVSYIPDFPFLYGRLTVYEFLTFIESLYHLDEPERKDRLLDLFELMPYRDRLIDDLSHGLRQRVIFSATFFRNPPVMIIDEPLVGLDPRSVRLIKDILSEERSSGKTILVSTHTLPFAQEVATRIGIINKGKLISVGTYSQLQEKQQSLRDLEDIFLSLTRP